jgi:hypothetical protein
MVRQAVRRPDVATTLGRDWRATVERARRTDRGALMVTLATIAQLYCRAIEAGDPTPVTTVAKQLGLAQAQVRDRLYKARQLGLLEPREPGRGRPRGELTRMAIDLLERKTP